MYDYATVTQQVNILNAIQDLNNNVVILNQSIIYLLVLICIILCSFIAHKFIMHCLGK